MLAVRSSYRPPRNTPPRMYGFVTRGLGCTSARSNEGGSAAWPNTAPERSAATVAHCHIRGMTRPPFYDDGLKQGKIAEQTENDARKFPILASFAAGLSYSDRDVVTP